MQVGVFHPCLGNVDVAVSVAKDFEQGSLAHPTVFLNVSCIADAVLLAMELFRLMGTDTFATRNSGGKVTLRASPSEQDGNIPY